ncbi:MAG: hypothetical protein M3305_17320 [Actinomycetota bacterium]|nr:hypothetical protein [Actinomycetota bacterium]
MVMENETVGTRSPERSPRSTYWLIVTGSKGRTEALAIDHDGEEALAVFSGEGEAEMFLRLSGGMGSGWWLKESEAGGLVSMLLGPYAGFRRVILDPAPGIVTEVVEPLILSRERFVRFLMRGWNAAIRSPRLPAGYNLERGSDLLTLRRPDGSALAVLSGR